MTRHRYLAIITLAAGLLIQPQAGASESTEVTWDDLVPPEAIFDDPFTRLDEDTLYELTLVAEVYDRLEAGGEVDAKTLARHEERVAALKDDDIDVDGLLAMRDEVAQERMAKIELTNGKLDGKKVRIPGYLLPLEFDGDKVTEFFLVPYVGACIHTPPPPPNQIVHVRTDEPFTTDGGLFTPVWVDGTIRVERNNANLSFVDGASNVPSGYALDAISVRHYE